MTEQEKAALVDEKVKRLIEQFGIAAGSPADKLRREGPETGVSGFEDAPRPAASWMDEVRNRKK